MTKCSPLTVEEQVAKHLEHTRRHNQAHREEHRKNDTLYHRRYRRLHREKCVEYEHRWRVTHPEVGARNSARHRALLQGSEGSFTPEEFRLKCKAYGNRCAYCNEEVPLTVDHIVPLSRGGSNSIENVVPACKHCNSTKGTRTYSEFLEYVKESNT